MPHLPHADTRLPLWLDAWAGAGRIVLLLDFDGTLAPIVPSPEDAAPPPATRETLLRLRAREDVTMAIVSGRGLGDARERLGLPEIAYAGNHGMEIEGPGLKRIHEEAAAARPQLAAVAARLRGELAVIEGAIVEDKGLTLSIHYRQVARPRVQEVRERVLAAVAEHPGIRTMEGKEILEVRPRVDWHKGRAVEFLLGEIAPPAGTPILYIGDDVTDEDAFRALAGWGGGEGVIVADPPPDGTAAASFLRSPEEVGELLAKLARGPS